MTAKRAPEAPRGLEWVVIAAAPPDVRTHPLRPCRPPGPASLVLLEQSRLWANKSEIEVKTQ